MMPQLPPVSPMAQSDPDAAPMPGGMSACPHCKMPVQLQKPAGPVMGDKPEKPAALRMPGGRPEGKPAPAKKKNAADAPLDELKEVIKSSQGKQNGND